MDRQKKKRETEIKRGKGVERKTEREAQREKIETDKEKN